MENFSVGVIDSGPLYAVVDPRDSEHRRCMQLLSSLRRRRLLLPILVVGEVGQLIERRLGPATAAAFLRGLGAFSVATPDQQDWQRIAELIELYRDFPLGVIDASVIALAERLGTDTIITLDQRHFRAVRPRHVEAFRLLPD